MHLTVMYITVIMYYKLNIQYGMYDFVHGMDCSSRRYTNNSTGVNATLIPTSSPNITTKINTAAM